MPRTSGLDAQRRVLFVVAIVVCPFAVWSIYLFFSRWPERWFTEPTDIVASVVAIACGLIAIALLPIRWYWRAMVGIAYAVAMWFALLVYGLHFVCKVFQDCL